MDPALLPPAIGKYSFVDKNLTRGMGPTLLASYWQIYRPISLLARVFANGQGYWGLFPGRVKLRHLISPCLTLSVIRYVSRVKWSNIREEVESFPSPRFVSY